MERGQYHYRTGAINGTLAGNSISVNTALGGHLNFYFSNGGGHTAGDWNYTAPTDVASNSQEAFHYVITDNDGDTASADLKVNIAAVNDAPVNTVPGAQSVNEDTALVFHTIAVSDVDANGGTEKVTLTVNLGSLSLFTIAGLNFTVGDGTGDSTMTFTGTIAAINAALNGLSYQGASTTTDPIRSRSRPTTRATPEPAPRSAIPTPLQSRSMR